jgi:hypothetical protein
MLALLFACLCSLLLISHSVCFLCVQLMSRLRQSDKKKREELERRSAAHTSAAAEPASTASAAQEAEAEAAAAQEKVKIKPLQPRDPNAIPNRQVVLVSATITPEVKV